MSRTVVVTGAGAGIGLAVAQGFAEAGDTVFACDVSAERLETALAALGPPAEGGVVDVSRFAEVEAFLRGAAAKTGRLDVLVNNAGIADGKPGIAETSVDLWRRVLEINLDGCFYGCKVAAEIMLEQGNGRIVNVASISSFRGGMNGVPYTVSKAGILGLTRRLAVDLGPSGITANAICPGAIETGISGNSRELLDADFPETSQGVGTSPEMVRVLVPAGRRGTPAEVAAAALFLASDAASYVNGAAIAVDGGWLAA